MGWSSIGNVSVTEDWLTFPNSVINSELFRFSQATVADQFNSCWVSRYFGAPEPGGRLYPWFRLYASNDPVLVYLPIPPAFKDANFLVYDLQIKLRMPYLPVPWFVEVEVWN